MENLGIAKKVDAAIAGAGYAALAVSGADHVQYLSGAPLPFLFTRRDRPAWVVWPAQGGPILVCPAEWAGSAAQLSRIADVRPYAASGNDRAAAWGLVAALLAEMAPEGSRIGLDMQRLPAGALPFLKQRLAGRKLEGCDGVLWDLRMVKTPAEVELLEDVAARADHGILAAVHHVSTTSNRTEKFFAEDIHVHALERQVDFTGYYGMSLAASGEHAAKFWPLAPKFGLGWERTPKPKEWVRMELRAMRAGYWSDAGRMLVMGQPSDEQWAAYRGLVSLREAALRVLRPGRRCSEVYRAIVDEARALDLRLMHELDLGHGVGVTPFEAPYLTGSDETELKPGMVLALNPVVCAIDGTLLRSTDTVVIRAEGAEVVGWFKDWREPYITAYTF